ncbi:MAG: PAS domain S-box protein [Spirochaetales bacterium]|nr:PAS domain S-box protein [Spirochaetales bacterium]
MDYDSLSREALVELLKESQCRNDTYFSLFSSLSEGIITVDGNEAISFMNMAAEEFTGWSFDEVQGRPFTEVVNTVDHFSSEPVDLRLRDIISHKKTSEYSGYLDLLDKKGTARHITATLIPISRECPHTELIVSLQDITDKRHIGEEISRIQKLDALSKLAGGIAHSFNNMLTGIMGFSELMSMELNGKKEDELLQYNQEIIESCERASSVTGELLNFSRKRNFGCIVVNLNDQIEEGADQLQTLLGPKITVETEIHAINQTFFADPFQIMEIILNLGKNAGYVMPEGGKILIKTENRFFTDEECRRKSRLMKPGVYFMMTVSDTGPGISKDVLPHIFEPFFTTKPLDKGSGLGLSSVYGSVVSHGGTISVKTKEGLGTSFEIALPLSYDFNYSVN